MASYSLNDLETRLDEDAKAFDQLINCIPAKFYITELFDEVVVPESKYTYGKRKSNKAESKKLALLSKKTKFDPENTANTLELVEQSKIQDDDEDQSTIEEAEQEDSEDDIELDSDNDDEGMELESDVEEIVPDARKKKGVTTLSVLKNQKEVEIVAFGGKSKNELREKLRIQIEEKRKNRKADEPQKLLKSKQKREKKKENKKKGKEENKDKSRGTTQVVREKVVVDETLLYEKKPFGKSVDSIKEDADIAFSKFEFQGVEKKKKGPSTAHNLLQKIEASKEKLNKIKATDETKAREISEKNAMKKALLLASGEKVKDDPRLLKKTIKRQLQIKNKSATLWNERKTKVKDDEADKQKKRTENLQKRIDAKKNKRLGIKPKKPVGKPKRPEGKSKPGGFKSGGKPKVNPKGKGKK